MFKPDLPAERILQVFMPGTIVVAGIWYLHRPLLMKYFPALAADSVLSEIGAASIGARTIVLVIACTCIGVILNQMADIAVVGLVEDESDSEKARRKERALVRLAFRIFTFRRGPDPRVRVIARYMDSPRRTWFSEMVQDWAGTEAGKLNQRQEAIITHQHILAHMAALSDQSRNAVKEAYSEVTMVASLFLALAVLFATAVSSLVSSFFLQFPVATQPKSVLLVATAIIYGVTLASAYAVRRRFAHFCALTITQALHYFRLSIPTDRLSSEHAREATTVHGRAATAGSP